MAASGFEGFEKRIELQFFGDDPLFTGSLGLRNLDFELLEEILHAVQCTVVSAVANRHFDAYVLSESSLFVYPNKIIIKTCGTTQLLKSVRPLVHLASDRLGLTVRMCKYTRGSFIFPKAQPFPHTSFEEEVIFLEENLPSRLCFRKACVMPSNVSSHSWHVFTACDSDDEDDSSHRHELGEDQDDALYTIEVCMTELDRASARKFFRRGAGDDERYSGDSAGREMTGLTGIGDINPRAFICDFGFDPCGYSMNGIDNDRYSTIHVTPEEGFSYASYECVGSIYDDPHEISRVLKKVAQVFRPGTMSVATTCGSHDVWRRVAKALELVGLKCRSCSADEFPAAGTVVFQTFTTTRRK